MITGDYKAKFRTSHHYRKDTARKSNKTWKNPMNHQNKLQLCKENEDMMLYSGNLNFLKNISNISNALSCKKSKTPKNKHSKYAKKGLGNIKPIKDYIYQHPTFSLSSSVLSVVDKKRKKKTHFKSLSQDSLSDITSKSFHRNLISPPKSEIKVRPKELCKCLYVCLSRGRQ